jgi:hypothetical protein
LVREFVNVSVNDVPSPAEVVAIYPDTSNEASKMTGGVSAAAESEDEKLIPLTKIGKDELEAQRKPCPNSLSREANWKLVEDGVRADARDVCFNYSRTAQCTKRLIDVRVSRMTLPPSRPAV